MSQENVDKIKSPLSEVINVLGGIGNIEADVDVDLNTLESVDFTKKPAHLLALDAQISSAQKQQAAMAADPLNDLFLVTFKHTGPIESLFFRSSKPLHLTIRDAQVWAKSLGYKYIACKKALVNVMSGYTNPMNNEGDITAAITGQSKFFNAVEQRALEKGPVSS
jgi:hypothetical protein